VAYSADIRGRVIASVGLQRRIKAKLLTDGVALRRATRSKECSLRSS
jgi:hypothetical protein